MKDKLNIWRNPAYFIAFGFGVGLLPWAPGTWGTLLAVPCYLLLVAVPLWLYGLFLAVGIVFGVWVCHIAERDSGVVDHPGIVWDEMMGYLVTMFAVPFTWYWLVIGFILFRFFDIVKPWPISLVQRKVTGGLGIMLDDLLAALPAWLILQVLAY